MNPRRAWSPTTATACAFALLVVAQAADYLTFLVMVETHGLGAERNPIVVAMASHGLWMLTTAKAALVVLVTSVFLVIRLRRPGAARLTLRFAIGVGAMGVTLPTWRPYESVSQVLGPR
jgi:hypothetical protein